MLVVHATFPIDSDSRDRALDLAHELVESSREEPGVISYNATTDVEDPNVLHFIEGYEDEAAFGEHAQSGHFREFESALPDLLAGEPTVTRFDVDEVTDVDL
jgi:quinol monooxygenase YgiN